jgi:hypothetical protein
VGRTRSTNRSTSIFHLAPLARAISHLLGVLQLHGFLSRSYVCRRRRVRGGGDRSIGAVLELPWRNAYSGDDAEQTGSRWSAGTPSPAHHLLCARAVARTDPNSELLTTSQCSARRPSLDSEMLMPRKVTLFPVGGNPNHSAGFHHEECATAPWPATRARAGQQRTANDRRQSVGSC